MGGQWERRRSLDEIIEDMEATGVQTYKQLHGVDPTDLSRPKIREDLFLDALEAVREYRGLVGPAVLREDEPAPDRVHLQAQADGTIAVDLPGYNAPLFIEDDGRTVRLEVDVAGDDYVTLTPGQVAQLTGLVSHLSDDPGAVRTVQSALHDLRLEARLGSVAGGEIVSASATPEEGRRILRALERYLLGETG